MPVDQLTATGSLADGVLRILGGAALDTTAVELGIDPADLADAVEGYHTAGLAALQQQVDSGWYQVRVTFPEWDTAETVAAQVLGPRLDQLVAAGAIGGWWYLRKYPCWRLRFARPRVAAVNQVLDDLTGKGALIRWWPSVYEAEVAAFGGPAGIDTVHTLFCADSRGVLDYLRRPQPELGRRQMSLLLLGALLHAAGLDWFERGDVFARVAQIRPLGDVDPAVDDPRLEALARKVRGLIAVPPEARGSLVGNGGPAAFAEPWHAAYLAAGRRLADAATAGTLRRGLRAVISHIVIFHWNRLGLTSTTQAVLARAAGEAFLPRS